MKKILSLLLALTLVFALVACSNEKDTTSEPDTSTTQTETESTDTNDTQTSETDTDESSSDTEAPSNSTPTSTPTTNTNKPTTNSNPTSTHTHIYSAATCTTPKKCSCGATEGTELGHLYNNNICIRCKHSNETYALAQEIIFKIIKSNMTEFEKVFAIHNYIIDNIEYDYKNYYNNTIPYSSYEAYAVLTTKKAVCQGYAEAFKLLCTTAGLSCETVNGLADNSNDGSYEGHAWNQVCIDGKWYNTDATWCDDFRRYDYFLVPDSHIYLDHKTDSAKHICIDSLQDKALGTYFGEKFINSEEKFNAMFEKALNNEAAEISFEFICYDEFAENISDLTEKKVNEYNAEQSLGIYQYRYTGSSVSRGGGKGSNLSYCKINLQTM